jgi:DNA-binding PadR family transcriptional regulator
MIILPEAQPHLPLTEATFFILLSLAPGPSHGYAIMKDVQNLSDQRVRLSTGTLYGALKRLLELGWIARVEATEPQDTGRTTHAYKLTELGRRILGAETARLQALIQAARARIGGLA